ncbi:hypothetical protein [Levilactobacillus sp. N40-8-2]|mgnify:FL=1|uniref:hypothetical protein n=1 Tax=Levilactobacillus muriae TaxID=3238987 RepID=UPI0038B3FAA4
MRKSVELWLKKNCKWLVVIVVPIMLVTMFLPVIPSNAVRLCILKSGHPVAALFSGPRKLPKSEFKYYSGNKQEMYYQINVPFETESANVDVLTVHKAVNQKFYQKYVAHLSIPLGP